MTPVVVDARVAEAEPIATSQNTVCRVEPEVDPVEITAPVQANAVKVSSVVTAAQPVFEATASSFND